MSTNPSENQPPYPAQQPMTQYPPAMYNYGSAGASYPPSSNPAAYPPPVETVPYNPAFPPVAPTAPPPSYESAVGGGKPSNTYPYPPAAPTSYPTYPSTTPDVEYGRTDASEFSGIISFSDKSIRLGFIRRVFAVLMLQLATTVGVICLFIFNDNVRGYVQGNWGLYISAYVVFFVLYFVLICCEGVRRNYPANVILLAIFTLSLSYLVGVISSFHETNIVLIMMGVTTLVCASVMIFACQTKYDFTTWGGVLFCAALAIFFLSIFTPLWLALQTTAGKIIIGGVLALVFVAFLAYDVQLVMGGRKYELSPEEYVFASLILYMDIIRIFLLLLALFGGRGSN